MISGMLNSQKIKSDFNIENAELLIWVILDAEHV